MTVCSDAEYQTRAPSRVSDRECKACVTASQCTANEFLTDKCGGVDNTRCAPCHATCDGCVGGAADECTDCAGVGVFHKSSADSDSGSCLDECPSRFYENVDVCSPCDASCKDCFGPGSSQCLNCDDGKSLSADACVSTCPSRTFSKDGVCVPCAVCASGSYAPSPCTPTADTECVAWTKCAVGEEQQRPGNNVEDRVCRACTVPDTFQPLADQLECLETTKCSFPNIESVKPTVSTDRICTCDRLTCSQIVRRAYQDLVCGEPTSKQTSEGVDLCCQGAPEASIRQVVREGDDYKARHTCDGCTDTCECEAGYRLVEVNERDVCQACDGIDGYASQAGATLCEDVTTCGRGEEEATAPTPSSDRVCAFCAAGMIDADSDGTTDCTPCAAGQYTPPGSIGSCTTFRCPVGAADKDSDPATPCEPCDLGQEYQDTLGQVKCTTVTTCAAGEQEAVRPTRFQDRVCSTCIPGKFKAEAGNGLPCRAVSQCAAGEEEAKAPTPSTDRVCQACVAGTTFKAVSGQASTCQPVTQCLAGEEELRGPTTVSDRQCGKCILGVTFKAAAGHDARCERVAPCHPTEFESTPATLTSDSVCTTAQTCTDNTYESEAPTLTSDRACSMCSGCPTGRFTVRPCTAVQDTQCSGCSPCSPGTYRAKTCTELSDTVCLNCTTCDAGYYMAEACKESANTKCAPQVVCTADEYLAEAPTARTPGRCAPLTQCAVGEYVSEKSTKTSDRECDPHSVCRRGEEQTIAPSLDHDRQCQLCPAGSTDKDDSRTNLCSPCVAGTYVPEGSSSQCSAYACAAGSADTDGKASTPCVDCVVGESYQGVRGETECVPVSVCKAGFQELLAPTLFADRLCVPCTLGRSFKAAAGSDTRCIAVDICELNEYEMSAPTLSTDRVCKVGTVCQATEYEVTPLTSSQDRTCKAWTVCTSAEYEAIPPTAFSDRVCKPIDTCTEQEYEATPPSPTSNRICRLYTTCQSDEYETRPATPTSDRLCNPTWVMTLYFGDADYATVAGTPSLSEAWTAAVKDELSAKGVNVQAIVNMTHTAGSVVTEVVTISDNVLVALYELLLQGALAVEGHSATLCGGDGYLTNPSAQDPRQPLICTDFTECGPGEYEVVAGTLTSDRVCRLPYLMPLHFVGANFTLRAGSPALVLNWTAAVTNVLVANSLNPAAFINMTLSEDGDHPLTDVFSTNDVFTKKLYNLALDGDVHVLGTTATLCGGKGFIKDARSRDPLAPIVCTRYLDCHSFEYILGPGTDLRDRVCAVVQECDNDEVEVQPPTATSDRVCALREASSGSAAAASTTIVAALMTLLVLVVLVVFVIWKRRKMSKDRRQRELVAKLGTQLGMDGANDIAQGNTLLRQLSVRGGVRLFDNPTFIDPAGPKPSWYVGQMTRGEAEEYILALPGQAGDFVVRESAANGNFVLSMLTKGDTFEHHKLFPDAQGRFMLNGDRLERECRTVQEVVDYLVTHMDGTGALLRIPAGDSFYGQTPTGHEPGESDDFYGSVRQEEAGDDFYGGIERKPEWLKGAMARTDAEAALQRDSTPGSFLVRESKARKGTYAISLVIDDGRVEHHSLRPENGAYLLNEAPLKAACTTLEEVVAHLQQHAETMTRTLRGGDAAGYSGIRNPGYTGSRFSQETGYADLPVGPDGPVQVNLPPARPPTMNPGYVESNEAAPPRPPKTAGSFRAAAVPASVAPMPFILAEDPDAPPRPPKTGNSFRGAPPVNRTAKPSGDAFA